MNNIWKKIRGYAIISIWGFNKERFLNLCRKNGVKLWNIKNSGNNVQLCIYSRDIDVLHNISSKTGCRFKVLNILGLPCFFQKYFNRFLYMAGIMFFIFSIKFLTSYIWIINIEGSINIPDSEILHICSQNGLYTGASKRDIDGKAIAEALKSKFDSISWINCTTDGVRATIKLAEATDSKPVITPQTPTDIIADKDCVITDITIRSGMPAVRIGDSIVKGDLLVSGTLVPVGFEENREPSFVHSSAEIRGKVKETKQIKIPLQYTEKRYTGKTTDSYSLDIFGKKFSLNFLNKEPAFKNYDTTESIRQLKIDDDHPFPFYLTRSVFREYNSIRLTLPQTKAENKAEAALIEYIVKEYPPNADILSTKISFNKEKDFIILTAEILSEQNIGEDTEITTSQEENKINGTAKNSSTQ